MPSHLRQVARALASAFLVGPWTRRSLLRLGEHVLGERLSWLSPVTTATLRRFPDPPTGHDAIDRIADVILGHRRFREALRDGARPPAVRRWLAAPPAMGQGPWPVPALTNVDELAGHLDLDPVQLSWLADTKGWLRHADRRQLHHYHRRWIRKHSGGHRLVESPKPRLKAVQRHLLDTIVDRMAAHFAAHGFVQGRSAVSHATVHAGRGVVIRLDLETFFATVSHARVYRLFRVAGYPNEVARVLAGLCTTSLPPAELAHAPRPSEDALDAFQRQRRHLLRRHLPQGAPTSPALANLCASRLDHRLSRAAESAGASYSRYADDLVFSGDGDFIRRAPRFVPLAAAIAIDEGFTVNFRKTRVMHRALRQEVCGLVVNERPNIPRADYDRLKAILTNCLRYGPATQNRAGHGDFRAHLRGKIAWLASVSPHRADKLLRLFERVDWS